MSEFLTKLRKETNHWVEGKIITKAQEKKIMALYGKKLEHYEKNRSSGKLANIILTIGAVLLGVGVILFVASNWDVIPDHLKTILLLAATFGSYFVGYYLAYEKRIHEKTGMAFLLLGALFFGASIFLIAQIYNVDAFNSNLVFLWIAGILPLAYAFKSRTIMTLSVGLIPLWYVLMLADHSTEESMYAIFLVWSLGLILYIVGLMHEQSNTQKYLAKPYKIIGLLMTVFITYIFVIEGLRSELQFENFESARNLFLGQSIGVLFLIFASMWMGNNRHEKFHFYEAIAAASVLFVQILFFFRIAEISYQAPLGFAFYAILFAMIAALITMGYKAKKPDYVNIGILFFIIEVTTIYFDFFFELLSRSLFFIGGGIALLVGGTLLEKNRRKLLDKIDE